MPDTDILVSAVTDEQMRDIDAYWTPERMRAASPVELPTLARDELRQLIERSRRDGTEEGIVLPSGPPQAWLRGSPYAADVDKRPYWNGGALFFTRDGSDYQCSAEFVGNDRVIMTAAHCLMDSDSGQWSTNVVFYRSYVGHWWGKGGQKVGVSCLCVKQGWRDTGDETWDYGFCYTRDASGAGWLGFKTGAPYSSWTAIGYPENYGGTDDMYAVTGDKGQFTGGLVQMTGNPMGHGSSGGAWIGGLSEDYDPNGNFAIGLNAFKYDDDPSSGWGPLFDWNTWDLYEYASANPC